MYAGAAPVNVVCKSTGTVAATSGITGGVIISVEGGSVKGFFSHLFGSLVAFFKAVYSPFTAHAVLSSSPAEPSSTNGLLYYYKFNNNLLDSLSGASPIVTGTPFYNSQGLDGVSLAFTDDPLSISFPAASTSAYSISMWVRPDVLDQMNLIFHAPAPEQDSPLSNQLRIDNGKFEHTTWDGSSHTILGSTTITLGQWYHVVGVAQSNGEMSLFVNGLQDGSSIPIGTLSNDGINYLLGTSSVDGSTPFNNFRGLLDEVRVYNRVLSSQEIADLFASQKIAFGYSNTLKSTSGYGTTTTSSSGYGTTTSTGGSTSTTGYGTTTTSSSGYGTTTSTGGSTSTTGYGTTTTTSTTYGNDVRYGYGTPTGYGVTCSDNDGGINTRLKGTTSGYRFDGTTTTQTDSCVASGTKVGSLVEFYCGYDATTKRYEVTSSTYSCTYGCNNGICLGSTGYGTSGYGYGYGSTSNGATCTDSDGGQVYGVPGVVTSSSSVPIYDTCVVASAARYSSAALCSGANCFLSEGYCSSTTPTVELVSCTYGCNNGACLYPTPGSTGYGTTPITGGYGTTVVDNPGATSQGIVCPAVYIEDSPQSLDSLWFNWKAVSKGLPSVQAGSGYGLSAGSYLFGSPGDKSFSLTLSYPGPYGSLTKTFNRDFKILYQGCSADGSTYYTSSGYGFIAIPTSSNASACAGNDRTRGTGDDCCPAGMLCGASGCNYPPATSAISKCSDYTNASSCINDPAGVIRGRDATSLLDVLGGNSLLNCGKETYNAKDNCVYTSTCACNWDTAAQSCLVFSDYTKKCTNVPLPVNKSTTSCGYGYGYGCTTPKYDPTGKNRTIDGGTTPGGTTPGGTTPGGTTPGGTTPDSVCVDTDGGDVPAVLGTVSSVNNGQYTDTCLQVNGDGSTSAVSSCTGSSCMLSEAVCDGTGFSLSYYNCNSCNAGACVSVNGKSDCTRDANGAITCPTGNGKGQTTTTGACSDGSQLVTENVVCSPEAIAAGTCTPKTLSTPIPCGRALYALPFFGGFQLGLALIILGIFYFVFFRKKN